MLKILNVSGLLCVVAVLCVSCDALRPESKWTEVACSRIASVGTCTNDQSAWYAKCAVTFEGGQPAILRAPVAVGHQYCKYLNQYGETLWRGPKE